ncbi:Envelope glycoprotein [Boothiomyces sp. JEL0838]|nr:Envelope glycoprotein [Boothiomyces sp. JEL0838]
MESAVVKNSQQLAKKPVEFQKPPPPTVVEEDEYVEGISKIIKRDFFPDLDKLKVQNELLDAITNMDAARATHLKEQLAKPEDQEKGLRLDAYQTKFTSEDDASFGTIVHKQNAANRELHHWFYEKEKAITLPEKFLIESGSSKEAKPVVTWEHNPKSALMYVPEGKELAAHEIPITRAAPKEIVHAATRFKVPPPVRLSETKAGIDLQTQKVWDVMAKATPGLFPSNSSPKKQNGYDLVPATPELKPNEDVDPSELMTWGMIESTPILVDSGQAHDGPTFSMAQTPRREVLANKLSDKATEAIRKRQGATPRFKTPLTRGQSPALQALAKSIGVGIDNALRASYSTPTNRTPGHISGFTPQRMKTGTPKIKSAKIIKPVQTTSTKPKPDSSITDNLLNL